MLLAGCSKDADISNSTTLSGNGEKTPLLINATLDTGKGLTRAAGKDFAKDDELLVYIRHTTGEEGGTGVGHYTYINTAPDPDYANQLVTIKKSSTAAMTVVNENVNSTTDLSPVYWDDFSNSSSDETNLRTDGHGLQSYYGYCYNGGTPSTSMNVSTSVLGWTVSTEQNTGTNLQKSDILWSPEQGTVPYNHSTAYNTGHGDFTIPFKHAMSEVTVTVTASAGFDGSTNPLSNTVLTLNAMNTVTQLNARLQSFLPLKQETENIQSITMRAESYTAESLTRDYTAIVAPGTKIVKNATFLTIEDAEKNYYEVKVNDDMLSTTAGKWGNGLVGANQIGEGYIVTQPGVNYHLELSIDKSTVQVSASLADWSDVTATGTGAILFTDDVTVTTTTSGFNNASAFSLFWVKHDDSHDTPAERTNTAYSYATTSTYDSGTGKWTNSPNLYWPNKNDSYYYRALATHSSGDIEVASPSITTTARGDAENKRTDGITKEGYILWGTTSGGTAISPRTGGVPMEFRVVNKSNVKFTLKTATSDAAMTLSEATISISNIYSTGNIILEDGLVEGTGDPTALDPVLTSDGGAGTYSSTSIPVLAQKISDDAVVTIKFTKDEQVYSTYKIPLKNCVIADSDTPITIWEGGHTYNYTIHVEKEAVKFSAAVKSWATVSGSGTATMVNE